MRTMRLASRRRLSVAAFATAAVTLVGAVAESSIDIVVL
jgi:hypothetical protein